MALENLKELNGVLEEIKSTVDKKNVEMVERIAKAEETVKGFAALADKVKTLEGNIDSLCEKHANELKSARMTATLSSTTPLPGQVFADDERAKSFAQFMVNVGCAMKGRGLRYAEKEVTPVSASSGGYIIPDTYVPEMIRIVPQVGQIQKIARQVPLGPGRTRIPRRGTGVTAYWVGAGKSITTSDPKTSMMNMEPEKLAALCLMDNEVADESLINVGQFIAFEQMYAIMKAEESAIINGAGAPSDGGIIGLLNSLAVTDVTMGSGDTGFDKLSWDDLVDLESNVVDGALDNARYVLSQSVLGLVKKLKDDQKRPIYMNPAGDMPATINGYPFTIVNAMPKLSGSGVSKRFLAFGDFQSGLYVGRRRELRVDSDTSYAFDADQTAYRAIESVDASFVAGSETGENPIAALKTAAT